MFRQFISRFYIFKEFFQLIERNPDDIRLFTGKKIYERRVLGAFGLATLGTWCFLAYFALPANPPHNLRLMRLFGIGFVMCGLCPGTSCVAVFTGKLDGLAVFAGIFTGLFIFAETEPGLNDFLNTSSIGDISLYELFNMEYGMLIFLIAAFAVLAFWFVGRVEKQFSKRKP